MAEADLKARLRRSLGEDDDVVSRFKEIRARWIAACRPAWERATKNQQFAGGPPELQWSEDDRELMRKKKAAYLAMNEIAPVIQTLRGKQIMQRFERHYIPRSKESAAWAEMMDTIDRAMMEACDAENAESAAFGDGPGTQGISWLAFEYDILEDKNGRITVQDVPIWEMLWPADEARKGNLTDRTGQIRGRWYAQKDVKRRWPDKFPQLSSRVGVGWPDRSNMEHSSPIPWQGMQGERPIEYYNIHLKQLWIERYEYRDIEGFYEVGVPMPLTDTAAQALAQSPTPLATMGFQPGAPLTYALASAIGQITGQDLFQVQEMDDKTLRGYKQQYKATQGEDVPKDFIVQKERWKYSYCIFCGDTLLEEGDNPIDDFTFEAMTGFPYPQASKVEFYGLCERLIDPQKWKNVFLSALVRIMQVNPKGVLVTERGVFRSRNEAMAQWSSPGGVVELERGKMSGPTKPYEFISGVQSPISTMMQSLMEYQDSAIPRLAGFNAAALGQLGPDLRRISGQVVNSVNEAAMATNAQLFDSLRLYRKRAGRKLLKFLYKFYEQEDVVELVGEDAAYSDIIDPMTGQPAIDPVTGQPQRQLLVPPKEQWLDTNWKLTVEEAAPAPEQKRAVWQSLTEAGALQVLLQPSPTTGQPILSPDDLVELIPDIPEPIRERMRQRIKVELDRVAQQQQQQAMMAQQGQQQPQQQQYAS